MTYERTPGSQPTKPYELFGLSEAERLHWRVSDERFNEIILDNKTQVHTIEVSSNTYGEFLFVTTSRPAVQSRICMTFYGLGFHEYRERWITDEWFWYQISPDIDLLKQQISSQEAKEMVQQQSEIIWPHVRLDMQTDRGRLFEMLADLTDDDGAFAEMEDIDDVSGFLKDSFDL